MQIWQSVDVPPRHSKPRRAGHTLDLMPVLNGEDDATSQWFFDALGWWWDAADTWDDCGGETVCGLMVVTLSHHGKPLQLDGGRAKFPQLWRPFAGLNLEECVARVGGRRPRWP